MKFISLASGSNGNCYYIGSNTSGILIDAGIGVRTIRKRLKDAGLSLDKVKAVFLTHDHIDHALSAGILGSKCFLPIFATRKTFEGIDKNGRISGKNDMNKNLIEKNTPFVLDEFEIEAFEVSHDSTDCVGYTVRLENKQFTLVTDLGFICPNVEKHVAKTNFLVIEANYDEQMLKDGSYPQSLKNRIISNSGHLCNAQTACFLGKINNPKMSHIWLCHLSKENNLPETAYNTVVEKFRQNKFSENGYTQIYVLPRMQSTQVFEL